MARHASLTNRTARAAAAVRGVLSSQPLFMALCCAAIAVAVAHRAWSDTLLWVRYDPNSSQILLAPVVFIWLLHARRQVVARAMCGGWLLGPFFFAVGWAAWSFGFYQCRMTFWHCGAVFMMAGAAITFLDAGALARYWPAFLILGFLVPDPGIGWYYLGRPLHAVATQLTQLVCDGLGMSAGVDGGLPGISGRQATIAEVCNRTRLVWPLFLIVYLFAFVTPMRAWLRALALATSPLIIIVASVVRLVPTLWVHEHLNAHAASVFRDANGWVILFVTFIVLVGFARLVRWALAPSESPPSGSPPSSGSRPSTSDPIDRRYPIRRILAGAAMTTLMLVAAAAEVWTAPAETDQAGYFRLVRESGARAPSAIGTWMGRDVPLDDDMALYVKLWMQPNLSINREYTDHLTGRRVNVIVVQVRDAGRLTSHDPTICYPAIGWELLERRHHDWRVSGLALTGTEYQFETGGSYAFRFAAVADMVLLPDGQVGRDMEPVRNQAHILSKRFFGAAHLQIICDAALPPEERERIVIEILHAYVPLIRTLGAGIVPRCQQTAEN